MEPREPVDPVDPRGGALGVEALAAELPAYDIERVVAYGGMGTVYAGRHRALERKVAIKVMPSRGGEAATEQEALFVKEARVMARLSHPGIIQVHDFGISRSGWLYLVMEWVEGINLEQMLDQQGGPFSPEVAGGMVLEVAEALAYAHAQGVVHGDVKPANVLVDLEGRVHLADLGLARGWQEAAAGAFGTPGYAAPELYDAAAMVDARADVYALGATLFEMLTGQTPDGPEQSPMALVPTVGHRWDALVRKATRYEAAARYQTIEELRQAVARLVIPSMPVREKAERPVKVPLAMDRRPLIGAEALPTLVPRRKRKPYGWMLAAMGVAVLAVAGLKWRKSREQAAAAMPTAVEMESLIPAAE